MDWKEKATRLLDKSLKIIPQELKIRSQENLFHIYPFMHSPFIFVENPVCY